MAAALTMQSSGAALHPFFTRPCNAPEAETATTRNADCRESGAAQDDTDVDGSAGVKKRGSTRGRKPKKGQDGKSQRTLAQVLNPTPPGETQQHEQREASGEEPTACASHGSDDLANDQDSQPAEAIDAAPGALAIQETPVNASPENPCRPPSPHVLILASSPRTNEKREMPQEFDDAVPSTPPKKMMRLGRGGKLASPSTKPKKDAALQDESVGKRRGRPRKAKEQPPTSRVVVCRYGELWSVEDRSSFGNRIASVLSGEEKITLPQTTPKKQRTPRKPKKPTHPFFGGNPKEKPAPKPPSPRKAAAITPGKLRAQAMQGRPYMPSNEVQHPVGSALLKDRLMVKHPGAREPPWPAKEQSHIRGLELDTVPGQSKDVGGRGKRKQTHPTPISDTELSVLHSFATSLEPEPEPALRPDGYHEPRSDLRPPKKHLVSGRQLAARIAPEVMASLPDPDQEMDESGYPTASQTSAHPALLRMYSALPTYLSAFDHCKGEVQGWAQKHAPTTSGEVLQPSREMTVLRDWLQSLTVNAVGEAPAVKPAAKAVPKPKKKRRRKDDDLDDFLLDSGDEVHDMDVLTDPEDAALTGSKRSLQSIVQSSNGHGKLSNAVLLSGPHGCGKTAAAYAVAKELGFQVFEISSAERRSGRDVLDRVGDMTENHIVKNHGVDSGELSASEDRSHMEAAFQKDLESGRQGKMNAFFQAKPAAASKVVKPKAKAANVQTLQKLQKALKKPAKEQQQSVILLEEVDVLFKEDKEFWTTVLKLIATSKRPFIMTCNDEDLVPLQAMSLHAILRFSPPPTDLAVDYLLLMAAVEGHLLKRKAITSLYSVHQQDLRASIISLDFWCQMGIGDPKGGLDWIYQRYPPGSDVDEHGHKLRVISEDTYQQGMGMVQPNQQIDGDAILSAWNDFGVDPTTILGWDQGLRGSTAHLEVMGPGMTGTDPMTLKDMAKFADSLSASDVYTTHHATDPTLPEITSKARLQYIEGLPLLESNERIEYTDLSAQVAVTSTLSAYHAFSPSAAVEHALTLRNLLSHTQSSHYSSASIQALSRHSFSCLDALASPSTSALSVSPGLEISALDGPLQPIVADIAPYVRAIVHYDTLLAEQRTMLGGTSKKARTTRAARSALEGSQRADTRREKWFGDMLQLDGEGVLATGGSGWPRVLETEERDGSEMPPGSSMESAGNIEMV